MAPGISGLPGVEKYQWMSSTPVMSGMLGKLLLYRPVGQQYE
jgi:hypothetical protein